MKPVTWEDISVERISNSVQRRVLWGDQGTFAQLTLASSTHVAKHRHSAEQFTCIIKGTIRLNVCLLYTSPSPRDLSTSRMPSSA